VIVVDLGDGTGAVGFESVDLRKVGRVDEEKSGGGPDERGDQHEKAEQDAAHELASADFNRRKIFVEGPHWESRSG
jgi:hypothetical protein